MGITLEGTIDKEKQLYNKHINAANHIREKMVSEIAMNNAKEHDEIAEEHRQIAEWLEKYQKIEQIRDMYNEHYIEWRGVDSCAAFRKIMKIVGDVRE